MQIISRQMPVNVKSAMLLTICFVLCFVTSRGFEGATIRSEANTDQNGHPWTGLTWSKDHQLQRSPISDHIKGIWQQLRFRVCNCIFRQLNKIRQGQKLHRNILLHGGLAHFPTNRKVWIVMICWPSGNYRESLKVVDAWKGPFLSLKKHPPLGHFSNINNLEKRKTT